MRMLRLLPAAVLMMAATQAGAQDAMKGGAMKQPAKAAAKADSAKGGAMAKGDAMKHDGMAKGDAMKKAAPAMKKDTIKR